MSHWVACTVLKSKRILIEVEDCDDPLQRGIDEAYDEECGAGETEIRDAEVVTGDRLDSERRHADDVYDLD